MAAVAIAIAAPYLAPLALGVLGITATATAIAIATAVIGITLSVGLSLAFRALGVGAPSAKNAVGPPQVFRQAITNSFIVYGKRRVGGLLAFFHPRQSGSEHYRYFVIACAGHRCQGVVSWMLGDEVVTVNGSNMVTSGKYASAAWLWFQRGLDSETANATFVSECGGKWTSNHKGNGIAAIYAKFKMTDAVVEAGMPNITAVIEGRDEILDTRTSTEGYSRNAALIFYDWMQIAREEGGFGAYPDEIPEDAWINAQANVCDETVNSAPRYAIDAVITTGAAPNEIRDVMVVNQAGSYTYSGGKHLMRPGYWVPVTETLSEDDLAAPIQVSPFSAADAVANEVQGTYISPSDNYQGAPLTTQAISSAPTDIRQIDVDLAFTTNKDQGDRVLKIMLNRAQAEKSVVWPMNISGLKVKALDTVQLATSRYGLDNYAWSVVNWGLSADWGVVAQLREENEEIYGEPLEVAPVAPPALAVSEPIDPALNAALANMPDIPPVTITADYSGVVDPAAQLPKNISVKRFHGATDVTTSSAWSMNVESGSITATIGAATGIVNITAIGSSSAITATSVHNGITLSRLLSVTKQIGPVPGTGGGGGASSTDSSFNSINGTTMAAISDELTVTVGASGEVDLSAPLWVTTAAALPDGTFHVYGIWQWWDSAAWVDVGTEVISSSPCTVENSGAEVFGGYISVIETKTGLTPSASEKFRLMARNDTGTRTMYFSGTASAVPA